MGRSHARAAGGCLTPRTTRLVSQSSAGRVDRTSTRRGATADQLAALQPVLTRPIHAFDLPATGRGVEIDEMIMVRVVDGVIVEAWEVWDEARCAASNQHDPGSPPTISRPCWQGFTSRTLSATERPSRIGSSQCPAGGSSSDRILRHQDRRGRALVRMALDHGNRGCWLQTRASSTGAVQLSRS